MTHTPHNSDLPDRALFGKRPSTETESYNKGLDECLSVMFPAALNAKQKAMTATPNERRLLKVYEKYMGGVISL